MLDVLNLVTRREANAEQTARLLNSQAMNIDVLDVAELLPDGWKLASTSGFLVRSLRRQLHARHENMIVKSIAMGQNLKVRSALAPVSGSWGTDEVLQVAEEAWLAARAEGAVIEEADDSDEEGSEAEKVVDEKTAGGMPVASSVVVDEKTGWHEEDDADELR